MANIIGSKDESTTVQVVSTGTKKAQVIVTQQTESGPVRETRHLLLKAGEWRDKRGNRYAL